MQAGTQGKRKTEWECSWAADALGLGIRCPRPLYSHTMSHPGPHQGNGMVDLMVRQKDANDTYMKNYRMTAFFTQDEFICMLPAPSTSTGLQSMRSHVTSPRARSCRACIMGDDVGTWFPSSNASEPVAILA